MNTILTVFDKTARIFLEPFFAHTSAAGERDLQTACRNGNHPFAMYPGDYALYELGTYDQDRGRIATHEEPVLVAELLEIVSKDAMNNAA